MTIFIQQKSFSLFLFSSLFSLFSLLSLLSSLSSPFLLPFFFFFLVFLRAHFTRQTVSLQESGKNSNNSSQDSQRERQCASCTNVRIKCVCGSITHSLSCWSFCDSRLNALCGGGNAENLKCFALNVVGLHPFYHVQSNVVPK